MSYFGFHLVIRKHRKQHPDVYDFYVPESAFPSEEARIAWVQQMEKKAKSLQEKSRRKQKMRPNFWCTGAYCQETARGHAILSTPPTFNRILSLERHQKAH